MPRSAQRRRDAAPADQGPRRCAIYTRKSSEEGLEQAFNSLDAQREACAAYVASQRHEGWTLLPTLYDDGGVSGGTLDRPALKQLLADIAASKVDLVVVYKVDRLTRSLADFAKIVDVFDASGASFVSVTQQFNTATSMGRLTLNMLLSFAQFEREVTGERIRDKIAASKRKGMWMGGLPPLGYDVVDRKLVVNKAEAATVRDIFTRYQALGSVNRLRHELAEAGVRSKLRAHIALPRMQGGQAFGRGALYTLLQNRLYRGEVAHRGAVHPGEHAAIIDAALWETVQARLARNRVAETDKTRAVSPSLLAGLIQDAQGQRLTPSHAVKNGRRYRYYVSATPGDQALRLPAADLETAVCERVLRLLADPTELLSLIAAALPNAAQQSAALQHAAAVVKAWPDAKMQERRKTLIALLDRIIAGPGEIALRIRPPALLGFLGQSASQCMELHTPVVLTIATRLRRAGMEMRLIVEGKTAMRNPDATIIRTLQRARNLHERLVANGLNATELAAQDGVTASYIIRVLRLAYLAPEIVAAILDGRQPIGLTAEKLIRDDRLPLVWNDQRRHLGFA